MNTVITPPQAEQITLYFREGSSDKVYQAAIEPRGELFVVNFAFGRRGSSLNTGTKTSSPVDHETARRTFDKLIREKMAKGYTPGPDGTPYQHGNNQERVTGILPQLLNPIDEQEVKRLLKNPAWCLQEKFDGRRVLIQKQGEQITAINRKGLVIGLASSIGVSAQKISSKLRNRRRVCGRCAVCIRPLGMGWRGLPAQALPETPGHPGSVDRRARNGAYRACGNGYRSKQQGGDISAPAKRKTRRRRAQAPGRTECPGKTG